MNDFDLFDEALKEIHSSEPLINFNEKVCEHKNIDMTFGNYICFDCGEELSKVLSTDKEWRFYGGGDDLCGNQNRCQIRKVDERIITKDLEGHSFPDDIILKANEIYVDVTSKKIISEEGEEIETYKIYRGKSRKAIVFACIFNAYKILEKPVSWENLAKSFKLSRKDCLTGLKIVNLHSCKKNNTPHISPINIINEIMDRLSGTKEQIIQVIEIYKMVENKSLKLKRSRPQSMASGIIFYWIKKTNKNITLKEFSEKIQISQITVEKVCNIVDDIISRTKNSIKQRKKICSV